MSFFTNFTDFRHEKETYWVHLNIFIDRQWAISNNGFRSDSLYEKKIGEDLVFNNALPKSLTINTSRVSKGKTKIVKRYGI